MDTIETEMANFLFYHGVVCSKLHMHLNARYSFQLACRFGHIPATRELGILYIQGKGGDVDIDEGSRLLHMAENAGDETASLALDMFLEF
jgi:TPR repeat protein